MNSKNLSLVVFILVALAQLYIPARMILNQEEVLNSGTDYKFRTAPIDPTDPLRGKYITLNFENNTINIQNQDDWLTGETVYVLLKKDSNGFAVIQSVSKTKIESTKEYLKTKVSGVNQNELVVKYPFDRYYMEESKAADAESLYRESQVDTNQVTYALVSIKEGEAVLKDVFINDIPIREHVIRARKNEK